MIMAKRGWEVVANDLSMLLFGIQDAVLMAENMVIAAESLAWGVVSWGIPLTGRNASRNNTSFPNGLPAGELVMGYPAEEFPPRPRYPLEFTLFEDRYPELTDGMIEEAVRVMDEGYLAQDYYRKQKAKIKLEMERKETFSYEDYSWTEHISRKWGQWLRDPKELLDQMEKCGFTIKTKE